MYTHNGRTIQANRAWTSDDGYQHPANWNVVWSNDDKKLWSVTWTDDPVKKSFDETFYWGYKVDADGNETDELIPRSLVDIEETTINIDGETVKKIDPITNEQIITRGLISIWVEKKKDEANGLLSKTDWYVVRAAEGGSAIPDAIATARAAVRTACAGIETKINACDTLDKFIALFATSEDGDGNVVKSDMDCYR